MVKHRHKQQHPQRRHPLILFLAVVAFYATMIFVWKSYRQWLALVRLDTAQFAYYHYDFIELRLRTHDAELLKRWQSGAPPQAMVTLDGHPIVTIAGVKSVDLKWEPAREAFIGRWPCPWNAQAGEYNPALVSATGIESRLRVTPFRIRYRKPKPLPRRFVVLTMENARPLSTMKVRTPDGQVKGWRGLLDWAEFLGADAFWLLGGETPGDKPGDVWLSYNFPVFPLMAQECRKRHIQFGLYAMNYLTVSNVRLARYRYAMDVVDARPKFTRAISLLDPQRPKDVAALLKRFKSIPGVDYVGLDYIRNALGGYELADDFFAEMPGLHPPKDWGQLAHDERMVWLARKKIMRRDDAFIDAWQWWRAHRVALIVKGIKREIGDDIPLWAFTLTWDKGWHHGQDPVMMNDAGVDADSIMLYEADSIQFTQMMKDWHDYVRRSDVQLLVGDVVDWPLHQYSPLGPQDFQNRMTTAMEFIYRDGPAKGIFIHDLNRALWGRLGPYSTMDWMKAARSAVRHFREIKEPDPVQPAVQGAPRHKKSAKLIRQGVKSDKSTGNQPMISPQAVR